MSVLTSVVDYSKMIKLSHSIFAMPFALAAAVLAAAQVGWTWTQFLWIVLCMVTARSAAMGFNRIADRDIDAENPRTARVSRSRRALSGRPAAHSAWARAHDANTTSGKRAVIRFSVPSSSSSRPR